MPVAACAAAKVCTSSSASGRSAHWRAERVKSCTAWQRSTARARGRDGARRRSTDGRRGAGRRGTPAGDAGGRASRRAKRPHGYRRQRRSSSAVAFHHGRSNSTSHYDRTRSTEGWMNRLPGTLTSPVAGPRCVRGTPADWKPRAGAAVVRRVGSLANPQPVHKRARNRARNCLPDDPQAGYEPSGRGVSPGPCGKCPFIRACNGNPASPFAWLACRVVMTGGPIDT